MVAVCIKSIANQFCGIGAFKNFSTEHIEEVNLKFGLKIGGKTGIPFLAEATSEGYFKIEVKCKFPNQ
ncbi:CU044_2847 family protein [Leptolyngbya sp. NIES-2104]|uniref:CU044_2847 family protein n=1 Tax=Leptolyngbya sp. NIES-2104 TaxID=1552121 RepID=UPI0006ECC41C|nr:hypothetical protein NIES2104_11680 [Leptolyngbya sp. NIES-2104]